MRQQFVPGDSSAARVHGGLVAQALAVLKKYSDEEIDFVVRLVAKRRGHPALGLMTPEKMLASFGELTEKLS